MSLERELTTMVEQALSSALATVREDILSLEAQVRGGAQSLEALQSSVAALASHSGRQEQSQGSVASKVELLAGTVQRLETQYDEAQFGVRLQNVSNKVLSEVQGRLADERLTSQIQMEALTERLVELIETVKREIVHNRNEMQSFRAELAQVKDDIDKLEKDWARYQRQVRNAGR